MTPDMDDVVHLRRAIELSVSAREHGNHPFGALLVARDGTVVLEAENAVVTGNDVTAHAELNLVRKAWATIDQDELASHTLHTSCEPCPMCSGAIFWSGIGRVVYALSEVSLIEVAGDGPGVLTLHLPSRDVFAAGSRAVEVVGPALEDEARVPHRGFWDAH